MPIITKGYVIDKDGKIKRDPKAGNVSKRLRIIRSKKTRAVSPAKASTAAIARGYKP